MAYRLNNISLYFRETSGMEAALGVATKAYSPHVLKDHLKAHYQIAVDRADTNTADMIIGMRHDPVQSKDTLSFNIYASPDYSSDTFDFAKTQTLAKFDVDLAEIGGREWRVYLDYVLGRVQITNEYRYNEERHDAHDQMAKKLQAVLAANGLKDYTDETDIQSEAILVGTYMEYRSLATNREYFNRAFGR